MPAFSRLQDDPERFARYYLRAINLLMWLTVPAFGFLLVGAEPLIVLVLGSKWRGAVPVFQILTLGASAQLLLDVTVWSLVGPWPVGSPIETIVGVLAHVDSLFAIGLPFGIKAVALSGSVLVLIVLPCILRYSFRGTMLTLPVSPALSDIRSWQASPVS